MDEAERGAERLEGELVSGSQVSTWKGVDLPMTPLPIPLRDEKTWICSSALIEGGVFPVSSPIFLCFTTAFSSHDPTTSP